jgi:undecaprenyl-phosphate galactose phosphotransferase
MVQLFSLIMLDVAAYYICLMLAIFSEFNIGLLFNFNYIFSADNISSFLFNFNYLFSIWWIPPSMVIILLFEKMYMVRYPFWEETRAIVKSVTIAVLFVFLTITVRNFLGNIPRTVLLYLWFYMIFILPLVRYWGKKLLFKLGPWKESVLIIGLSDRAISAVEGLTKEEHLGYSVIGFLDDSASRKKSVEIRGKSYKVYTGIKNIRKFVQLLKVETVFIATPYSDQQELTEFVNEIYKHVKRVVIIPDIKGVAIFNSELHYLFMEKLFLIQVNNNLNSTPNMVAKRIFDFTCTILGSIVLSPFFLVIALLIKFTSRGNIIFIQKRIGRNGKEFNIFKFRTMYLDAEERLEKILKSNPAAKKEWDKNFKLKGDPRVTPIGKFLRSTSLDELPQVLNILRGEMSLVGPRPVIMEEIDKYYGNFKQYYYSVRPGLLGLWQVSGRSDTDYSFRVQTDVWYVQNWSMWLDITILFKGVSTVIKKEGAY